MNFSDTTNKNGLIQMCETYTALDDTGITSDSTLLAKFTNLINEALNDVMPVIMSKIDGIRFDDANHSGAPTGTASLVSGTSRYTYATDASSNPVLNISKVWVQSPSSPNYDVLLTKVLPSDPEFNDVISPLSSATGTPTMYAELDGRVHLYPIPNYSQSDAIKFLFERAASYFTAADTTKKPGIPSIFHNLLALRASRTYVSIYKPQNTTLLSYLNAEIARKDQEIDALYNKRSPEQAIMTVDNDTCA